MSKAKRKWVSVRPLPSIRNFPQQYDVSAGNGVQGGGGSSDVAAEGPQAGAIPESGGTQPALPMPTLQLCIHAQSGRKCQYVGNCSFAHSPEERDMWTFMKENKSECKGRPSDPALPDTATHQQAQELLLPLPLPPQTIPSLRPPLLTDSLTARPGVPPAPKSGVGGRGRGQNGGRIPSHRAPCPLLPTSPGHAADL